MLENQWNIPQRQCEDETEEEKKCKQRNIYKFVQSRETDVLEVGTSSNKKGGHCHSSCTLSKLIDKIKILSA